MDPVLPAGSIHPMARLYKAARRALVPAACAAAIASLHAAEEADVLIYRATPAGIAAAIAADQSGSRVIIIEPTAHVGGMMTSGGLVVSDVGHFPGIGGISRDFFRRVQAYYDETYGKDSPQAKTAALWNKPGTVYEPKVGEKIFQQMLVERPGIEIKFQQDVDIAELQQQLTARKAILKLPQ